MGKIIAVGGGKLAEGATRSIDERIIALARRPEQPMALYVPTASEDNQERCADFQRAYGDRCRVELLLLSRHPTRAAIWEQISRADIIYVGGGNTLKMMTQWRHLGVDQMMIEAYGRGAVMCGVSAGAICWFRDGNSDSRRFRTGAETFPLIRVAGLGLIRASACPHFDSETQRPASFREMIRQRGGIGIALEDCTALEIVDGAWRILRSAPGARAYRLAKQGDDVQTEELPISDTPSPIHELLPFT